MEGRAERRRGATDSTDEAREAVGMACVYRHIFFITPLMVCLERQIALTPTMSPAPSQARTNQDSYGGVAGQNLVLLNHLQQPLAPVERVHCPERLRQRCGARQMRGWKRASWKIWWRSRAPGAFCLQPGPAAHLAAHAPAQPDELPPGSEGVSPPRPCELVEGTIIRSCCSALSTVPRPHRRLIRR